MRNPRYELTETTLEVRVLIPREVHISTKKRETRIQNGMSSRYKQPKSPHPHGFEASSSDVPATDLRDYLTMKKSVHQITPQCHCERLISLVLSDCHCVSDNPAISFSLVVSSFKLDQETTIPEEVVL